MKLTLGDMVRVTKATGFLRNYEGQVGKITSFKDTDEDCGYIEFSNGSEFYFLLEDDTLEPAIRTIEDVQEGDLITNGTYFRRVLGRCGKVVFRTQSYTMGDKEHGSTFDSIQELKDENYSIVQDTQEEVIEVNGKKYKADEVRERLSELKALE